MNLNTPPHENVENTNTANTTGQDKVVCPYCNNLSDNNLKCSVCGAQFYNNQLPSQPQFILPQNHNVNPYQNVNYNANPYYNLPYQNYPMLSNNYPVGAQQPRKTATWVIVSIIILLVFSSTSLLALIALNRNLTAMKKEVYESTDDYYNWWQDEYGDDYNNDDYGAYGDDDNSGLVDEEDNDGLISYNKVDIISYVPELIELENGKKYIVYSVNFFSYSSVVETFSSADFQLKLDGASVPISPTTDKDEEIGLITLKSVALGAFGNAYREFIAFEVSAEVFSEVEFSLNKGDTVLPIRVDNFS